MSMNSMKNLKHLKISSDLTDKTLESTALEIINSNHLEIYNKKLESCDFVFAQDDYYNLSNNFK